MMHANSIFFGAAAGVFFVAFVVPAGRDNVYCSVV